MAYPQKSAFIYADDPFEYLVLGSDYRDEALVFTARAFETEPSSSAFSEFKPKMKVTLVDWFEYLDPFMNDCCTNGLSAIALDRKTRKVAAAILVNDLALMREDSFLKYELGDFPLSPNVKILTQLDKLAMESYPELKQGQKPGYGVDLLMVGVHPEYRGKNLAQKMLECTLPLSKNKGYRIACAETTGEFSANLFRNNLAKEVCRIDAREFIWKGEKVFKLIRKPHGQWRYWVKNLKDEHLFRSKL